MTTTIDEQLVTDILEWIHATLGVPCTAMRSKTQSAHEARERLITLVRAYGVSRAYVSAITGIPLSTLAHAKAAKVIDGSYQWVTQFRSWREITMTEPKGETQ